MSHGANCEAVNRWGRTALHEGASAGEAAVCNLLVSLGARHDAKDGPLLDGMTALEIAKQYHWADVCTALAAAQRKRVRLAGGGSTTFTSSFPGFEPEPFGPMRMNPRATWGHASKHGTWGRPRDHTRPKFRSRVTGVTSGANGVLGADAKLSDMPMVLG